MNESERRVSSYETAAEFDDFDRSRDELNWAHARRVLGQDMSIDSVLMPRSARGGIEVHGRLWRASHEVFGKWVQGLAELKLLPFLAADQGQAEPNAVKVSLVAAPASPRPPRIIVNIVLFLLTCLSTMWVGSLYGTSELRNPWALEQLLSGWPFAGTLLLILGVHELGHFFAARYHGIAVSLPYFIPVPLSFGTLGAFIRLRQPVWDRRKLFDVGVAGPLAGLVVALPLLYVGLSTSELGLWSGNVGLEGNSLLYLGAKYLIFSEWLPNFTTGRDVSVNQVAFAAWIGLLATGLNLLPIGNLDGGHVVFSLFGFKARVWNRAALAALAVLGVSGFQPLQEAWPFLEHIGYTFWLFWVWFLFLVVGSTHTATLDMVTELDPRRRWIGYGTLVLFVITFVPVPFRQIFFLG